MDKLRYYLKVYFSITSAIIVVNIILFTVTLILSVSKGGIFEADGNVLAVFGANAYDLVYKGEVWRLLISTYLHANIFHIALNMLALYQIGEVIEKFYGRAKFFSIYTIAALGASVASFFITRGFSLGASGAIFGLLGLILSQRYKKNTYTPDLPISVAQIIPIILINLVFGFTTRGIDNAAHIGGLFTGFLIGLMMEPEISFNPSKIPEILSKIFLFLSILATIGGVVFSLSSIIQYRSIFV